MLIKCNINDIINENITLFLPFIIIKNKTEGFFIINRYYLN